MTQLLVARSDVGEFRRRFKWMALFATLPYGKFAHGIYRCAALLKSSMEKRQVGRLQPGSD